MTRTIEIDHLARVEGHGGITVELDGDEVKRVEFDIVEGIRLFEGLVRGRHYREVPAIVSRVCAICSHGHTLTALAALEDALGLTVSAQTRKLRDLAFQGANIASHALHFFCLALPDFVEQPGVLALAASAPEPVKLALRLKRLGNLVQEVVGGRAVHPVNYVLGGFGKLPDTADLVALREALQQGLRDCQAALPFLRGVAVPRFVDEPIRCAAIEPDGDTFFFGDTIVVSDGTRIPVALYRDFTNERTVPHSHAKHSTCDGRPYMVGALARLTLHGARLGGLASAVANDLGLRLPATNILANDLAQLVELVYSIEHACEVTGALLQDGLRAEPPAVVPERAGRGTAATEVPRGVLFHSYVLDAEGRVEAADVITPTAQNLEHAELMMRATVRDGVGMTDAVLAHRLEMVARAYDPCISCAVHVIRAR